MKVPVPPSLFDFGLTEADMAALTKTGRIQAAIGIVVVVWLFLHYIAPALSKASFGQAVALLGDGIPRPVDARNRRRWR